MEIPESSTLAENAKKSLSLSRHCERRRLSDAYIDSPAVGYRSAQGISSFRWISRRQNQCPCRGVVLPVFFFKRIYLGHAAYNMGREKS